MVGLQRFAADRGGGVINPTIGAGLARFAMMWGSAVTALAHELDLLGVELGKSAGAVVTIDRVGAR